VLRSAIERSSRPHPSPALRFQLAVMLDKQGDFAKAESELMTLIADEPRHAQALNYLGYSWTEKGVKLAQGEELIRRALDVEPANRYYLDSLGWSLHRQRHDQEAMERLQQAAAGLEASRDPEEAVVFDHLAEVAQALGDAMQADRASDQARRIRERAKEKPDAAVERLEKEHGL
jgi:predicted Zn-dependent protease